LNCRPNSLKAKPLEANSKVLELFPTILNGLMEGNATVVDRSSWIYECSVTNYGRLPVLHLQLKFSHYLSLV